MAIKGKTRSRAKGKQVSRAPRRAPVEVKPPFFMRRWVQLTLAALAGAAIVLLAFWVIRGLHNNHATAAANADHAKRVAAASKLEVALGGALKGIATQGQSGAPPNLFATLGPSLASLAAGKAPKGTDTTIKSVADGVTAATGALSKFNLATTLHNQGFSPAQINSLLSAQALIDQSLSLYAKSAANAKLALATKGEARKQLAQAALADQESATAAFQQGWQLLIAALQEAGVGTSSPGTGAAPSP